MFSFGSHRRPISGRQIIIGPALIQWPASLSATAGTLPLPTTKHVEWVARCAAAGKHVLLEKPIAPDLAGCVAIARACRNAKRALMDGTMFMK